MDPKYSIIKVCTILRLVGPCLDETCPRRLLPGYAQFDLVRYKDFLEYWYIACFKFSNYTFDRAFSAHL